MGHARVKVTLTHEPVPVGILQGMLELIKEILVPLEMKLLSQDSF